MLFGSLSHFSFVSQCQGREILRSDQGTVLNVSIYMYIK